MNQAKLWAKLAGKCFLVLLPLWLVWSYIWFFPFGYMNALAVQYINNKVLIQEAMGKSYDVLILGDSVSNASFEPEYLSERTLNLGQNTATPIEAYFVLSEYLQRHQAPKVCFLVFAIHHMRGENGLYNGNFFSHRFSINKELEILQQAQLYEEKSIIQKTVYEAYKEWIGYRLRLPNKYLHALVNASFNGRKKSNLDAIKLTSIHRGTYMSRTVKESTDYKDRPYKEYIVHPLYDAYYRKIFDLCDANGIQVHVVMTPICPNVRCTDRYQTELHNYHSY